MRAYVYRSYGPVEGIEKAELQKPVPAGAQVLIKVMATGLNVSDLYLLKGSPFIARFWSGLSRPKYPVLGADVAGVVEALGPQASRFKIGDEVFGDLSGIGRGGFGEYVCAGEELLCRKPAKLSFEEAAALPMAAVTALQGMRKAAVSAGDTVLVHGASGGVGGFAIQIAKALGCKVTAVCSASNIAAARAAGADHVIDYSREDFAAAGIRYDAIVAANGYRPLREYLDALVPNGSYVVTGGSGKQLAQVMFLGPFIKRGRKKLGSVMAQPKPEDLAFVAELAEKGAIKPHIDKIYRLDDVTEALRHFERGHLTGKLVVRVAG